MIVTTKAQEQLNKVLNSGECLEIGLKGGGCNGLMITLEKIQLTGITELSIERIPYSQTRHRRHTYKAVILITKIKDFLKDLWLTQVKVQEDADVVTALLFHRCNNFIIFRR